MALWMNQGKINLTLNSKNVVGVGTAFLTSAVPARPGQPLVVNGVIMEIATVTSDTTMTLALNYTGATATNLAYFILTTMEGSYNDLARRAAQVMGYFQGYMDVYQTLFTGTGSVTVTMPDGTVATLPTWAEQSKVENIQAGTMKGPMVVANMKAAMKVSNQTSIAYQDAANTQFHHLAFGNTFQIGAGATAATVLWKIDQVGAVTQAGQLNFVDANSRVMRSAAGQIRLSGNSLSFVDAANGSYFSSNCYYTGSTWGKWIPAAVGSMLAVENGNLNFSSSPAGVTSLSLKFAVTPDGTVSSAQASTRYWGEYGVATYRAAELTGVAGNLRAALSYPFKITANYALDAFIGSYSNGSGPGNLHHVLGFTDGGSYTPSWMFGANGSMSYYSAAGAGTIGTIASQSPMTAPAFTPTSDGRLKPEKLRKAIEDASALLRKLYPQYYFKKYGIDIEKGFYEFGFVADEVEEHEPRLVFETNDEHKLKHLAINGITTHLVKGWQEHDARLEAVEDLLKDIDKRLKAAGI